MQTPKFSLKIKNLSYWSTIVAAGIALKEYYTKNVMDAKTIATETKGIATEVKKGVETFQKDIDNLQENFILKYQESVDSIEFSKDLLEELKKITNTNSDSELYDYVSKIFEIERLGKEVREIFNKPEPDIEKFNFSILDIDKLLSTMRNHSNSKDVSEFIDGLNLNLQNLVEYVHNLSEIELIAFLNLSGLIAIFLAGYTLVIIKFGDFFIQYFKLEEKFPYLSIFFLLRRKITTISLVFHLGTSLILLLILIFVNLHKFIGW